MSLSLFTRRYSTHVQSYKESMARISNQAMILTSSFSAKSTTNTNNISLDTLHGMALSSATSLSVHPRTLIQFNLQVPSATSSNLHKNRWFALHLLPPTSHSVDLVKCFSRASKYSTHDNPRKITAPFAELEPHDFCLASDVYKESHNLPFFSYNHTVTAKSLGESQIDIPLLTTAERVFICTIDKFFTVDDHEIWVGEVQDILLHKDHQDVKSGGLLFFNRSFHKLGSSLA